MKKCNLEFLSRLQEHCTSDIIVGITQQWQEMQYAYRARAFV